MLTIERAQRGGARYAAKRTPMQPQPLHGAAGAIAWVMCAVPVTFGFWYPPLYLIKLAVADPEARFGPRLYGLVTNTFTLAGVAALAAVVIALLLAYAARTVKHPLVRGANRLAVLGLCSTWSGDRCRHSFALGKFDNCHSRLDRSEFGIKTGLLLTGSMTALIYAYVVRFLAVAFQSVEAGLTRVTLSMDDAARSLGLSPARTLARVHVPIIWGSLATAALLVFVDVMKELPATFAMRPFNFDTLAVEAYNLAKDERIAEAAVPSLVMVGIALLPLILLSRQIARSSLNRSS